MKKLFLFTFVVALLLVTASAHAQSQKSVYNHHNAFSPTFMTNNGNLFRSADGTPGKLYWQNEADYKVTAKIDTASKVLSGEVIIKYVNNSPSDLKQLWLQLVHNNQRSDAVAAQISGGARRMMTPSFSGKTGFTLHKVRLKTNGTWEKADYVVYGTRMQIRFPKELKSDGGMIKIDINYDLKLPHHGRSSYTKTKNGVIYDVAYWYPRMCVYDDISGWNTLPFLGQGEFYLDYGTIDYKITLPDGMLVAGSGKLMNPEEVLTSEELKQLKKARRSGKTVMIRSKNDLDEMATAKSKDGLLTWHFHMENTRDVAFAASKAFIWDAAHANIQNGKEGALAMSFYPVESVGENRWNHATHHLKYAIEFFSQYLIPYPYPAAISVGGPTGGMEFPGITFDSYRAKGYGEFYLIVHEIGHTWFPMIVGSNERRNGWMDEGFNTFIDVLAHKNYDHGKYAPKSDAEFAPKTGNPADDIVPFMTRKGAQPIVSRADALKGKYYHAIEYFKTAYGLVLLRSIILGHKRFDYAFRHYVKAWKFKHPGYKDFFRAMNNFSGANLNWFWRGWFLNNWKLDQAVMGVSYMNDDPEKGAAITLMNMDKLPMPVLMTVKTATGKTKHIKLPVQIWMKDAKYVLHLPTHSKITSVQLDPNHKLPDVNRSNNSWPR